MLRHLVVVTAILLALAGCGDDDEAATDRAAEPGPASAATVGEPSDPPDLGTVVRVLDGDTADIEIQGVVERVRFIGIDTPEPVGGRRDAECFGDEASELTERLLPEGTVVRLERDVEARDPFDRLLAYVFRVDDDLFVNLHLAETGYADQLVIEPNSAYAPVIGPAVQNAREQGLGLWGACGGADVVLD